MNTTTPMPKTGSSLRFIEILTGLLSLIIGIIYLAPLKIFGITLGIQIGFLSTIIFGIVLLAVAVFKLIDTFSFGIAGLTNQINAGTSILIIITVVIILFFQIIATGQAWLHFLFGIGLLSYAIGRVTIGVLGRGYSFGLRAFAIGLGSAIGVLSIIVILFRLILISEVKTANGITQSSYLSYGNFVIIALILIGVDFLVSAILGTLLRRQKQSP